MATIRILRDRPHVFEVQLLEGRVAEDIEVWRPLGRISQGPGPSYHAYVAEPAVPVFASSAEWIYREIPARQKTLEAALDELRRFVR